MVAHVLTLLCILYSRHMNRDYTFCHTHALCFFQTDHSHCDTRVMLEAQNSRKVLENSTKSCLQQPPHPSFMSFIHYSSTTGLYKQVKRICGRDALKALSLNEALK